MPEWLQGNEWAAWLALALILGVVEAATVDLVFLMLAGGALAAAVAALVGAGFVGQVLIGAVVAVALLGVVRPVAKRHLEVRGDAPAIGTARYVGKVGTAVEQIDENRGLLKLEGDTWTARIAPGDTPVGADTQARVTAVDGATLVVTAVAPVQDLPPRRPESGESKELGSD